MRGVRNEHASQTGIRIINLTLTKRIMVQNAPVATISRIISCRQKTDKPKRKWNVALRVLRSLYKEDSYSINGAFNDAKLGALNVQ